MEQGVSESFMTRAIGRRVIYKVKINCPYIRVDIFKRLEITCVIHI